MLVSKIKKASCNFSQLLQGRIEKVNQGSKLTAEKASVIIS